MDNKGDSGVTLKVFLSWSGEQSHALAAILRDWLPTVLHFVDPWMSSKDIAKGKRWGTEIGDHLEQARYCIVCVTPGVEREPWVNFEAGAVSKIVKDSYVSPLLLGVSVNDLGDLPLSLFQCTPFEKDEVRSLLRSINQAAGSPVPEARLDKSLDFSWASLQGMVQQIDLSAREDPQDEEEEGDDEPFEILDSAAEAILVSLALSDRHHPTTEQIAAHLNETPLRTQYHLDLLVEQGLLHDYLAIGAPPKYGITKEGRAYVVENELDQ